MVRALAFLFCTSLAADPMVLSGPGPHRPDLEILHDRDGSLTFERVVAL